MPQPNLICTVYQQRPMGKALVHRAKMVQVVPLDGEPQVVWVADLPRSAWIQGTFQVGRATDLSRRWTMYVDQQPPPLPTDPWDSGE